MRIFASLVLTAASAFALDGRAIVTEAVATLGGTPVIAAVEAWHVEGRGRENLSADYQGIAPGRPAWREHEERIYVDARTMSVAWHRRSARNDGSVRWRTMIHGDRQSGWVDYASGRGVLRPNATPEERRRGLARRIPHLLLSEVLTRATRIESPRENVVVAELPGAAAPLELTFDRKLLRTLRYRVADVDVQWSWNGWKRDERLGFVPASHRIDVNGVRFHEVAYSRYGVASPEGAALLTVPADLKPVGAPAPPLADPPKAEGVHVVDVRGFTLMFVEFADFVVAFEAPNLHPTFEVIPAAPPAVNISAEYLALIRQRVPSKPVRYVVISHHHSDHMSGIREFADATILVAPGHQRAARAWAPNARIETVRERRAITDGRRTLEVLEVGRNPHTDENLVLWLPQERILIQGDLFYYSDGDPFPPSGRDRMNRFFAGWLRRRGLEPRAVYGVHGTGAAGPAHLASAH